MNNAPELSFASGSVHDCPLACGTRRGSERLTCSRRAGWTGESDQFSLELVRSGVADADRTGALIADEPRRRRLEQPPLSGQSVHRLEIGRVAGALAHQLVCCARMFVR